MNIGFNKPFMTGKELGYITEAYQNAKLAGDGPFTARCSGWLEQSIGTAKALLTHSCTAALEMAAILLEAEPGSEVIMPSYTFVSTANAFVLRGLTPVFLDVRADTFNLDERQIEAAITPLTRAIVPVHYAGVACEMDTIMAIARRHDLRVIEDAAQGIMADYHGKPLGSIGDLGALSFHETKNIISGEGGALLVNDPALIERAEILREKGTNRSRFFRGQVDKYTWIDIGSSYLPSELTAAFLWAQLEQAEQLTQRRLALWQGYHAAFAELEAEGCVRRPIVPEGSHHNAHMYYLLLPDLSARQRLIEMLQAVGIHAVFHYVPLHDSPAGQRYGRTVGDMAVTREVSERLVRLPLWLGLEDHQQRVIDAVCQAVRTICA